MSTDIFTESATVEIFPQKGGWVYIRVPEKYSELGKDRADRGLIPIIASVEDYSWKTSLLPMGDKTHFIPLNAKVRKLKNIKVGGKLKFSFKFQ
jgi:hypothetical protein